MSNEDILKQVLGVFNARFDSVELQLVDIKQRIEVVEEELGEIKETVEMNRENINTLLEWSDDVGKLMQVDLIKRD